MTQTQLTVQYAKDRDAAFMAFVDDGDFGHLDALMRHYRKSYVPHTDVGAASVYKAVQHCTAIPDEVKDRAIAKCLELGFVPWIGAVR